MANNEKPASNPEAQQILFVYYLNKIYDGKLYLKDNLEKVIDKTSLKILKQALGELLDDVKVQLERMETVYKMLGEEPSAKFDAPIKTIIQNACDYRNNADTVIVNDMDIMVHLQLVEHVNIISYRILKKLASLLGYDEIERLMQECFDEAKDDDELFYAIAKEYLGDGA